VKYLFVSSSVEMESIQLVAVKGVFLFKKCEKTKIPLHLYLTGEYPFPVKRLVTKDACRNFIGQIARRNCIGDLDVQPKDFERDHQELAKLPY